ncbi:glycosyltransferase family 4 protein [Patescibacteria group bacterium]|nr:glycosyltransferase family 4 protein [Patescibacteria group bacterium]MBP9710322.1 glycosyltransferase family 4 protein [Patescibacteria group bacterium]
MAHPLVTQILWKLDRAGAERMVLALAQRLPLHGFRVRVVAAGGGGVMAKDFREAGIPLAIGPQVASHARRQSLQFLQRELRNHWPSVLHTHLGGDIWGGMAALRLGVRPWVATIHDVQQQAWVKGWLRGQMLRRADTVVCISDTVRKHLSQVYRRTQAVEVIRLGVEVARTLESLQVERRLQRFIVVGRLVPDKRVDLIITALAGIREPWHLVVAGDGPERWRLEQMVDRLRLRARVQFVGSVADIRLHLLQADVCLFASRLEGQGLAVLEAAAVGLPVITSELPAVRELFPEEAMTFVPQDADARVWTQVLQTVMYDPRAAFERAQQAHHIVQEQCSIERMVEEYAELYQRLLLKKK